MIAVDEIFQRNYAQQHSGLPKRDNRSGGLAVVSAGVVSR